MKENGGLVRNDNPPAHCLEALAPDAAGGPNILGHGGDALGVDVAEVGVL